MAFSCYTFFFFPLSLGSLTCNMLFSLHDIYIYFYFIFLHMPFFDSLSFLSIALISITINNTTSNQCPNDFKFENSWLVIMNIFLHIYHPLFELNNLIHSTNFFLHIAMSNSCKFIMQHCIIDRPDSPDICEIAIRRSRWDRFFLFYITTFLVSNFIRSFHLSILSYFFPINYSIIAHL